MKWQQQQTEQVNFTMTAKQHSKHGILSHACTSQVLCALSALVLYGSAQHQQCRELEGPHDTL